MKLCKDEIIESIKDRWGITPKQVVPVNTYSFYLLSGGANVNTRYTWNAFDVSMINGYPSYTFEQPLFIGNYSLMIQPNNINTGVLARLFVETTYQISIDMSDNANGWYHDSDDFELRRWGNLTDGDPFPGIREAEYWSAGNWFQNMFTFQIQWTIQTGAGGALSVYIGQWFEGYRLYFA